MKINRYSMSEVAKKAPELPGVYVWYCSLCIGRADVQSDDSFFNLLDSYTNKFGRQQMSVKASLNFDLVWDGTISSEVNSKNSSSILDSGLSECSRMLIYKMLEKSQPVFFQPLYIGKAERCLRSRLNQHVAEFVKLKELIKTSNNYIYEGEDDFAQRAVSLGYSEDQLAVHTIDVGDVSEFKVDDVGKAVRLVEMYLNKWSTPLLGRK